MSSADDSGPLFPPALGYVYALVNPVWPDIVKIGETYSLARRLGQYRTSDPYRAYRMLGWSDVLTDPWKAERELHSRLDAYRVAPRSEWFRITEAQALAALNTLRRQPLSAAPPTQPDEPPDDWYADGGEHDGPSAWG